MSDYHDQVAVVTGGGHGIGRAMAEALAARGARVVVADIAEERVAKVAERIGGIAAVCDVGDRDAVQRLVDTAVAAYGGVDIAVSNAGISDVGPDLASTEGQIRCVVDVNLLAHVWMAQAVLPAMVDKGRGALIQTVSSAALITGPSPMSYTLSKHGALGFAEWVALNYASQGIKVVCLCPNAVNTGMLGRNEDAEDAAVSADLVASIGEVVEPEECARSALDALDAGRFLALPHPRVAESFARKATDYDAWLAKTSQRLARMRANE